MKVRRLGLCEYAQTWHAMQAFIAAASDETPEEVWLLQHPPVYTLGKSGKREHLLRENGIPLIHSDRGGQITYHAPGQLVVYLLLNLTRRKLGLRKLVRLLERSVVTLLAQYGISARGDAAAPGVYVDGAKIAALGLRVRHGWTYHGISLNVQMDLAPFADINPCGYANLAVTQLSALAEVESLDALQTQFAAVLVQQLENATRTG